MYLRAKFKVSRIILTSFRQRVCVCVCVCVVGGGGGWGGGGGRMGGGNFTPSSTSIQTPKKHTQIRVKVGQGKVRGTSITLT